MYDLEDKALRRYPNAHFCADCEPGSVEPVALHPQEGHRLRSLVPLNSHCLVQARRSRRGRVTHREASCGLAWGRGRNCRRERFNARRQSRRRIINSHGHLLLQVAVVRRPVVLAHRWAPFDFQVLLRSSLGTPSAPCFVRRSSSASRQRTDRGIRVAFASCLRSSNFS